MNTISVPVVINKDGTLSISDSFEIPSGKFELVLYWAERDIDIPKSYGQRELTFAEGKKIMLQAGRLAIGYKAPADYQPLTPEQCMEIGKLPPGARPTHELIDEDRGEY